MQRQEPGDLDPGRVRAIRIERREDEATTDAREHGDDRGHHERDGAQALPAHGEDASEQVGEQLWLEARAETQHQHADGHEEGQDEPENRIERQPADPLETVQCKADPDGHRRRRQERWHAADDTDRDPCQ
jgi:hypothetical protein